MEKILPVEVEFAVRLLGPADERAVCLLGNAAELGAWDVGKAVPMEVAERQDGESRWRVSVVFADPCAPVEYKYVVKHARTRELVSWEAMPGNRTLTIAKGTNVARDRPSRQSSTYEALRMPVPGPREAALGNNGNTNGFQEWRCCRTSKEANPWWEVDLGKEYAISSVHLWKCMTYHEQPKNPEGRPPATSKTSTSSPAPPLWLFVSKEPLSREANSLADAHEKAEADDTSAHAFQVERCYNSRVRTLTFPPPENPHDEARSPDTVDPNITTESVGVVGRFVRLQRASASSTLQFAELEVLSQDPGASDDSQEAREQNYSIVKHEDGFYGVDGSVTGDLHEYVESGWINPAAGTSELQLWIGNFDATKPAVQWLDGEPKHECVVLEVLHEKQVVRDNQAGTQYDCKASSTKKQRLDAGAGSVTWESVSVESKGATLLDKSSTELRQLLEAQLDIQEVADITGHLNNASTSTAADGQPFSTWLFNVDFSRFLEDATVNLLGDKAKTKTYSKGETLLSYGEQKRTVFYIVSGEVELFGPESSLGKKLLGSVGEGTFFNEMGLFAQWGKQQASFHAKGDVTCQLLDFDTLLTVAGYNKVDAIREHYIRESHKSSSVLRGDETANATASSRTVHTTDATHAQVFRVRGVPTELVSGTGNDNYGLCHRWMLNVYDCQQDAATGVQVKKGLLGSAYLLPSQIGKHGEGNQTIPIFANPASGTGSYGIIGQLSLSYLVLTPFVHPKNNIVNVWRSYWRERPPLNIGHRGMGRSYYQVDGFRHALTRENTLASFILAGRSGADYVEFDVQLTKERVPVIYHDFQLNVGLEDKRAGAFGTKAEEYKIGIHDMTLRQLSQSYTAPIPHKSTKEKAALKKRVKKHWSRLRGGKQGSSRTPPSPPLALTSDTADADEDHLVDFFPRLEDLLKHVPAEVGLNVEIKYPDDFIHTSMRSSWQFAINEYLNAILRCVFDHAGSRRIFFSCFDPSICIALRAKQTRYPVLFLTYGSMAPDAVDARLTLQFAANLVKMEKLQGIVSNSNSFLETPELAPLVKKYTQAALLTWGDHNTDHKSVQLQKRYAVDGVISDNIIDLIRQDKKLLAQRNQ